MYPVGENSSRTRCNNCSTEVSILTKCWCLFPQVCFLHRLSQKQNLVYLVVAAHGPQFAACLVHGLSAFLLAVCQDSGNSLTVVLIASKIIKLLLVTILGILFSSIIAIVEPSHKVTHWIILIIATSFAIALAVALILMYCRALSALL